MPSILTGAPGSNLTLLLNFFDETSGIPADPTAVQLDITYGSEFGVVSDIAGPFFYTPGNPATPGFLYRISTGQYAFIWHVPTNAPSGIYVANWSCVYGLNNYLVPDNFQIVGGFSPGVSSADVGYWTGSLSYAAQGVNIPIGGVDANGTSWLLKSLGGWDSAPAVGSVIQRSGDHGGWPTRQYFGPRIITMTLLASARSQALRDVARAQMQQACPINDLAVLTYNEPIPKLAYVRRNASASVTESCPTLVDAEFTVPLVAPDPRKYGAVPHTQTITATPSSGIGLTVPFTVPAVLPAQPLTGSGTITNAGNFETPAIVTISGPITAPALVNVTTGRSISYSQLTLSATDLLVVDLDARQGYLNGAFRPADVYSAWWRLAPGDQVIQLAGTTAGGAAAVVAWSDAWT